MATVAILANPANDAAAEAGQGRRAAGCMPRATGVAHPRCWGCPTVVEEDGRPSALSRGRPWPGVDLAVSLGGDGTFLRMVPLAHAAGVPILGVNFGHLGYLLQVQPPDVETALARALSGDVVLEERSVLTVTSDGGQIAVDENDPSLALSDEPGAGARSGWR